MHVPDRTEGAFKRTRDRQPKVVLQHAGPASSLSFSYCSCERRRARGRIINAIFSSRSLSVRSWKTQFCGRGQWTIERTDQNGISPLPLSCVVNYASRRCRRDRKSEREVVSSVAIFPPLTLLLFCLDYARESHSINVTRARDYDTSPGASLTVSAASLHRGSNFECFVMLWPMIRETAFRKSSVKILWEFCVDARELALP